MLIQSNLTSLITYNPLALTLDSSLTDAARMLVQTGSAHWPVVNDERQLVGLLSERELVGALSHRQPALVAAGDGANAQPSVADTMSDPRHCVTLDETPRQVLTTMLDHELYWLPVVEEDVVVGVTTTADFLREFSYGQIGLAKSQVSEIMERVEVVDGDATLDDAWQALLEQAADCVGIVRGDFPLGVLSERDLRLARCRVAVTDWLGAHADFVDSECRGPSTVLELVAAAPTIRPGERLQGAATLMLDHDRQAIAVVNQANRLMGAVSEHGILRRMLNYLI